GPRRRLTAALLLAGLAAAPGAHAQGAARIWTVALSFRQIHSTNLFPYIGNGPGDVVDAPTLGATYARVTPTGSVTASASGWGVLFHEQGQFDRYGTSLVLGASRRLSPRSSLSLSGAALSGLSGESVYAARFQYPQVDVSSKQGSARLSVALTPRTTAIID